MVLHTLDVVAKLLTQLDLGFVLLGLAEGLEHELDLVVQVLLLNLLPQLHLLVLLLDPDHGLNVPDGHGLAAQLALLLSDLLVKLSELLLVQLGGLREHVLPLITNVVFEGPLVEGLYIRPDPESLRLYFLLGLLIHVLVGFDVRADDKVLQLLVVLGVLIILQHTKHVEPGKDRIRQIHVLQECQGGVIPPVLRVLLLHHLAPLLQGLTNTLFLDRNRLLLHLLVDTRPVLIIHLIELVNQTDTAVL